VSGSRQSERAVPPRLPGQEAGTFVARRAVAKQTRCAGPREAQCTSTPSGDLRTLDLYGPIRRATSA
jgi:hypothetical protein